MQSENLSTPQVRPELMLSATLYLLSQCAVDQLTPQRAAAVIKHLELIASQEPLAPLLRETATKLVDHWRNVLTSLNREAAAKRDGEPERHLPNFSELRALLH